MYGKWSWFSHGYYGYYQIIWGDPANFLDVGGTASAETVEAGFRIILKDSNVKAILLNILVESLDVIGLQMVSYKHIKILEKLVFLLL